jgi:cytochrome c oxidase cbb3-type subunit 2
MPPYRYLFEKRKISGARSDKALDLTGPDAPKPGYEVVPKPEAEKLVAYLMSLDKSHPLNEVKGSAPEVAAK